jgi:hypothetical protein
VITLAIILAVVVVASIVVTVLAALRSRSEFPKSKDRFNWRLPLCVVVGTGIVLVSLMVYSPYGSLLYTYLIAPIICLICLLLLLAAVLRKRPRQCLSMLLTLVAFLAASGALLKNEDALRPSLRWLLWSHRFKAEVLAQPAPVNGELRHMEWEATGFAGVANNTVYLVFDPTDSLSAAHSPGKFNGIPCKVPLVRRLESHWYSVWFYTDEVWGQCPWSGAGGR